MPQQHLIGPFVRRFLVEELTRDRNFSPNTLKSYRDAIRLLFHFLAERHATDPTRVTVEQVDDTLLRDFLRDCKERRGNAQTTCNQRLAAFHSLFRFIGRHEPALVEQAARIQGIPIALTTHNQGRVLGLGSRSSLWRGSARHQQPDNEKGEASARGLHGGSKPSTATLVVQSPEDARG